MNLKNKLFLVTGGGSGMGQQLVLSLLKRECKVIAVDINEAGLEDTARLSDNNPMLTHYVLNVTDKDAVNRLANEIISFNGIDGIINNAGIIQPFVRTEEIDANTAKRIFDVNFWGTLNMIQAFLPHLRTRNEAMVVNVSSMGGFLPIPGQAIYGASKAAVKMLSESIAMEIRGTNASVMTVFPGAINTNIKINSGISAAKNEDAAGKALSPETAAEMIVNAMMTNETELYVGRDSQMMGLLVRTDPSEAKNKIASMINHKF